MRRPQAVDEWGTVAKGINNGKSYIRFSKVRRAPAVQYEYPRPYHGVVARTRLWALGCAREPRLGGAPTVRDGKKPRRVVSV